MTSRQSRSRSCTTASPAGFRGTAHSAVCTELGHLHRVAKIGPDAVFIEGHVVLGGQAPAVYNQGGAGLLAADCTQ